MKKITLVTIISILFLMLSSLIAYVLRFAKLNNMWIIFVIGLCILFISGIFAFSFKNNKLINILCLIIIAIALGFLIRSWYIFKEYDNTLLTMFLVSLSCSIYLWLFYFLLYIPFLEKHCGMFMIVFIIISVIVYIIIVTTTKTTYISTFGYYMIVEMSFIIGMCLKSKTYSQLLRNMVISSYSVFIVAIIIAFLALCGDGADFDFEFDLSGGDTPKLSSPKDKKVINDLENRKYYY